MAKNIINNLAIKAYCDTKIIYPGVFNLCPKWSYEPLYVCYQSVITFRTRKNIIELFNTDRVISKERYPIENTNNAIKVMKDK